MAVEILTLKLEYKKRECDNELAYLIHCRTVFFSFLINKIFWLLIILLVPVE